MDFMELDRLHHAAVRRDATPEDGWAQLAAATAALSRDFLDLDLNPDDAIARVHAAADARQLAADALALADVLAPNSRHLWASPQRLEVLLAELADQAAPPPVGNTSALTRHTSNEIALTVRGAQISWAARRDGDETVKELLRGVLECERFASALT